MNKKIITLQLAILYLFAISNCAFAVENIFHGQINKDANIRNEQNTLFTGDTYNINKKDIIKMTVSKVLDGSDAKTNDEFFAEVTEDLEGNGGIIIPKGTVAHGYIKKVETAKKLCRNGALDLGFDYIITPDGNEIHIDGNTTTRLHPVKEATDVIAKNMVYVTAGGVTGGLFALNLYGLMGAASSQGTVVAGGAALGGALGLSVAISHKGKDVLISPGDEITVKISTPQNLPVYKKSAFPEKELHLKGFDIKISDVTYEKGLYDEVDKIVLNVTINNNTNKEFSTFDLALINKDRTTYYPDVFDEKYTVFKELKSGETFSGNIPFSVDNVKNNFWLTVYDHTSRKILSEISIDNAYKTVSEEKHKKNNKLIKKKKNYLKEYTPFEGSDIF